MLFRSKRYQTMKTLAKKILILFIPMISLLVIMLLIIIKSDFKFDDINKNVDDLIQKQNNSDTVIIGDSVSYQLFISSVTLFTYSKCSEAYHHLI